MADKPLSGSEFAKKIAKITGKKVTFTVTGGGATQVTTGSVSKKGRVTQKTTQLSGRTAPEIVFKDSGSLSIRQQSIQEVAKQKQQQARSILARQQAIISQIQNIPRPETAEELTRKAFGKIIERKTFQGERVTLGEFTKAVFGSGKIDLSLLTKKDIKDIKSNIKEINKITNENKRIIAFNKEVSKQNKAVLEAAKQLKAPKGVVIDSPTTLEKFSNFIIKRDLALQNKGVSQAERLKKAREARAQLIKRAPAALKPGLIASEIIIRGGDIGFGAVKGITTGFGEKIGQAGVKAAFLEAAAIENVKSGDFKRFFKELTSGEAATVAANSLAIAKRSQIDGKVRLNPEGVANIAAAAVLASVPVFIKARGRVIKGKAPTSGSKQALKETGSVFVDKGKTFIVNAKGKVIQVAKGKGNVRLIRNEILKLQKLQQSLIAKGSVSTTKSIPSIGSKAKANTLFVNNRTGTVRVSNSSGRVFKVGNIKDLKGSILKKIQKVTKKAEKPLTTRQKTKIQLQKDNIVSQQRGFKNLKEQSKFESLLKRIEKGTSTKITKGKAKIVRSINARRAEIQLRKIIQKSTQKRNLLSKLKETEKIKAKKTKVKKVIKKKEVSNSKLLKERSELNKELKKLQKDRSLLLNKIKRTKSRSSRREFLKEDLKLDKKIDSALKKLNKKKIKITIKDKSQSQIRKIKRKEIVRELKRKKLLDIIKRQKELSRQAKTPSIVKQIGPKKFNELTSRQQTEFLKSISAKRRGELLQKAQKELSRTRLRPESKTKLRKIVRKDIKESFKDVKKELIRKISKPIQGPRRIKELSKFEQKQIKIFLQNQKQLAISIKQIPKGKTVSARKARKVFRKQVLKQIETLNRSKGRKIIRKQIIKSQDIKKPGTEQKLPKKIRKELEEAISGSKLRVRTRNGEVVIQRGVGAQTKTSIIRPRDTVKSINREIGIIRRKLTSIKKKSPSIQDKVERALNKIKQREQTLIKKAKVIQQRELNRIRTKDVQAQRRGFKDVNEEQLLLKLKSKLLRGQATKIDLAKLKVTRTKISTRKGLASKVQAQQIQKLVQKSKSADVLKQKKVKTITGSKSGPFLTRKTVQFRVKPKAKAKKKVTKRIFPFVKSKKDIEIQKRVQRQIQSARREQILIAKQQQVSQRRVKRSTSKREIKLSGKSTKTLARSTVLSAFFGTPSFSLVKSNNNIVDLRKITPKISQDLKIIIDPQSISQVSSTLKTINKLKQRKDFKSLLKTIPGLKSQIKSLEKTKQVLTVAQDIKSKLKSGLKLSQQLKQDQKQQQLQQQQLQQKLKLKQKLRQKIKPKTIKPVKPKRIIPRIPILPTLPKPNKRPKRKSSQRFLGQVKQGTKLLSTTRRGLTKNRAINDATFIADNTAQASITLKRTKPGKKARDVAISGRIKKFRKSRKPGSKLLVERRTHRIDSEGEKRGITARGLIAIRRKAKMKLKRRIIKKTTGAKRRILKRKPAAKKVSRMKSILRGRRKSKRK